MINILIVDDHPMVGEGTRAIIEQKANMAATFIADANTVAEVIMEKTYDVYLIDLHMPTTNGIELTKNILQIDPDATVLIYTGYDIAPHYNLLMDAGATGFVSKTASPEQLITVIRCALRGEVVVPLQLLKQLRRVNTESLVNVGEPNLGKMTLSRKEQEILEGVLRGLTNKEIASELSMGQRTIEYHLTKTFAKLGVTSRTEAIMKAKEHGLLSMRSLGKE
ncbi:response regulator transcription factor [Sporosarcina sp. HYO08]|uniref:response regulator transcription factor n=1 Tax=Sporosarcina sp. HYO08 TaxID=1759557 RepID=UPI0007987F9A|nr:response regulator transcription factor [Sporosarcina sp. HYO08]KXH78364.1 LuxR family transcriptional regulator [Sporosarcina sp. HYO08]